MPLKSVKTLKDNKWRYTALLAGFFLLVAPFTLFTRAVLLAIVNQSQATLHTLCFRMPLDWFFSGRIYMLIGSVSAAFVLGVVIISFVVGPLFCGWICPVGAVSEAASRFAPIPRKYHFRIKNPSVTSGLRYGFLFGFITVGIIAAYKIMAEIGSVCCRYCSASILQNLASGFFGNPDALAYWHSGGLIVLTGWLIVGGIGFAGGRGWCLFFCPLGAVSNLAHKAGAKLGFYKVKFDEEKCLSCVSCLVDCPTWAIREDKLVDRSLCIGCNECTHSCAGGAYTYGRGKEIA